MSAASALTLFAFSYQNHPLRVKQDADGEPLFHAGDLCAILGHCNPSQAIRQHVDECDLTKREVIDSLGRTQIANFVREPGMWALILGSHAEYAKPVKRWVTAEVLPSIRKTGSYAMPGAESAEAQAMRSEIAAMRKQLASLQKSLPASKKTRRDSIRDKVAAYLARNRPAFTNPDRVGEEVLHKARLSREEREAVIDGFKQMGYWRR